MPALTAATLAIRPQALAAAQTRGARLAEEGYVFEFCSIFEEAFTVTTPKGDQYKGWLPGGLIEYPEGKCSCKQWGREKVCKHVIGALYEQHDRARYAEMEAAQDEHDSYAEAVAASVGAGRWDYLGPATPWQSDAILDVIDGKAFIVEAAPIMPLRRAAEFHAHQAATQSPDLTDEQLEILARPVNMANAKAFFEASQHFPEMPVLRADAARGIPTANWPVCGVCGREYAAWDEAGTIPDTECWYCAKRQN